MLPLQDTVRSRSFSVVNWLLIVLNVLAFFIELAMGPRLEGFVRTYGFVPARFLAHPYTTWPTIFTSMFLHGGWAHLISNMWALYIFGDNVEDRMGSRRYLLFYLLSGVAAAIVHLVFNTSSTMPSVGASGAISGVLAAYLLFFPTARVITLVPMFFLPWFVAVPAILYLGMWFVSQLLNGLASIVSGVQAFGGVAWWAHVGGFVAGLILAPLFARKRYIRRYYPDEFFPW